MRTHPLNIAHLVSGLVLLGIAGIWALGASNLVDVEARWLVPLVLLVAGTVGLAAAVVRPRERR